MWRLRNSLAWSGVIRTVKTTSQLPSPSCPHIPWPWTSPQHQSEEGRIDSSTFEIPCSQGFQSLLVTKIWPSWSAEGKKTFSKIKRLRWQTFIPVINWLLWVAQPPVCIAPNNNAMFKHNYLTSSLIGFILPHIHLWGGRALEGKGSRRGRGWRGREGWGPKGVRIQSIKQLHDLEDIWLTKVTMKDNTEKQNNSLLLIPLYCSE